MYWVKDWQTGKKLISTKSVCKKNLFAFTQMSPNIWWCICWLKLHFFLHSAVNLKHPAHLMMQKKQWLDVPIWKLFCKHHVLDTYLSFSSPPNHHSCPLIWQLCKCGNVFCSLVGTRTYLTDISSPTPVLLDFHLTQGLLSTSVPFTTPNILEGQQMSLTWILPVKDEKKQLLNEFTF